MKSMGLETWVCFLTINPSWRGIQKVGETGIFYTGWMLANLQIFKYVAYPVARIEQERQGKPHMFLGIRGINVKRVYLK